jgi:hypothetical protein
VRFNRRKGSSRTNCIRAIRATMVPLKINARTNRCGRIPIHSSSRKPAQGRRCQISSRIEASSPVPADSDTAMIQIAAAAIALAGRFLRISPPAQPRAYPENTQTASNHSLAAEKGCSDAGQNTSGIRKATPRAIHSSRKEIDTPPILNDSYRPGAITYNNHSIAGRIIFSGSKITRRSPASTWPISNSSYPAFFPVLMVRSTSFSGTKT